MAVLVLATLKIWSKLASTSIDQSIELRGTILDGVVDSTSSSSESPASLVESVTLRPIQSEGSEAADEQDEEVRDSLGRIQSAEDQEDIVEDIIRPVICQ